MDSKDSIFSSSSEFSRDGMEYQRFYCIKIRSWKLACVDGAQHRFQSHQQSKLHPDLCVRVGGMGSFQGIAAKSNSLPRLQALVLARCRVLRAP